jgi:hypothetical protein
MEYLRHPTATASARWAAMHVLTHHRLEPRVTDRVGRAVRRTVELALRRRRSGTQWLAGLDDRS